MAFMTGFSSMCVYSYKQNDQNVADGWFLPRLCIDEITSR